MGIIDIFSRGSKSCKCAAVIVAAGSSERMGADKLMIKLDGVPVLVRTLKAFQNAEQISEIVVVTRMDAVERVADLCRENGIDKISKVVAGGKTRMESSLIGVSSVSSGAKLIAIHDAARPLVSHELIKRTVTAAAEHMAAVPVIPSTDTLKVVDENELVVGTVDRSNTYRVQTPQVFDAVLIKGALTRAAEKGLVLTDDSAAVDMTGFKSYAVAGEDDNIKITTPRDIAVAEALLKTRSAE